MEVPDEDTQKTKTIIQSIIPFNGDTTEYTENTTIHGLKYLGERRRPWAEKIFWILIFVFCFVVLGYFIYIIVEKWNRCPVILVEDDAYTPIFKIPFPAVTICPQVKMKLEKFNYLTGLLNPTSPRFIAVSDQICHEFVTNLMRDSIKGHLTDFLNVTHIETIYMVSPNINETIKTASFSTKFVTLANDNSSTTSTKEEENNIFNLFSPILTNEGMCFTFNMPKDILREDSLRKDYPLNFLKDNIENWDFEDGYNFEGKEGSLFPRNTFGAGIQFSLSLQLTSQNIDIYQLCQPSDVGFRVAIHSPGVYPNTFEDFISIKYQTSNKITLEPKIIKTSKELKNYDPKKRQCYFNKERKLQFYKIYNRVNCKLECFANFTLEKEDCVHFSLPMANNTNICGSKQHNFGDWYDYSENVDSYLNFLESFEALQNFDEDERKMAEPCDCLPECNSIEYEYNIETEEIDSFKILNKINTNDEFKHDGTLLTMLKIYFKRTRVYGKTRNQLYTISDLVSNFGGLIGLFMGASVLSAFELLYFCIVRNFCSSACK